MKKVFTGSVVVLAFLLMLVMFSVISFRFTVQAYSIDLNGGVPAFTKAIFLSVGSIRMTINDVSQGFQNFIGGIGNFFGNVGNSITDGWNSFIQGVANATAGIYNFLFGWINS